MGSRSDDQIADDWGKPITVGGTGQSGGFLGGSLGAQAQQSAVNRQANSMNDLLEAQLRMQANAIASSAATYAESLSATPSPAIGEIRRGVDGRIIVFTGDGVWEVVNDSNSLEASYNPYQITLQQRESDYRANREWAAYQRAAMQQATIFNPPSMTNPPAPKPTVETIDHKPRVIELEEEK